MNKVLKWAGGVLVLLAVLLVIAYVVTGPERPAGNSVSAEWLQPGPYDVGRQDYLLVDESRPTDTNRGEPGLPMRTFPTTVWYPEDAGGDLPLIVHSHGILSSRTEMPYLMEQLASYGYVVAAADFPLTSGSTPGGANALDVVNQPADVSFLIDSVINLSGDDKPWTGNVDITRIGLSGYSLGGLTTFLTTYHAQLRDPRVAAAVAIAGPSAPFAPAFFDTSDVPLLVIAGTADALIEHRRHAADLTERVANGAVVTIEGGSHLGFLGAAEPTFRLMDNPDSLGCSAVLGALDGNPNAAFELLGGLPQGVDMSRDLPPICGGEMGEAMHPARQHMITQVGVLSFFESVFSPDPAWRQAAGTTLREALTSDFREASIAE